LAYLELGEERPISGIETVQLDRFTRRRFALRPETQGTICEGEVPVHGGIVGAESRCVLVGNASRSPIAPLEGKIARLHGVYALLGPELTRLTSLRLGHIQLVPVVRVHSFEEMCVSEIGEDG
jgi:hypothetical protein